MADHFVIDGEMRTTIGIYQHIGRYRITAAVALQTTHPPRYWNIGNHFTPFRYWPCHKSSVTVPTPGISTGSSSLTRYIGGSNRPNFSDPTMRPVLFRNAPAKASC